MPVPQTRRRLPSFEEHAVAQKELGSLQLLGSRSTCASGPWEAENDGGRLLGISPVLDLGSVWDWRS